MAGEAAAKKNRFEAEYSRFFNFPQYSALKSPTLLHITAKKKANRFCYGTWVVAKSTSVIQLLRSGDDSSPIISVSVDGAIVEEHFVSSLCYSWPQVSCVPECPVRGSRAVFLSYRDSSGQIQKFAVRFSKSCFAEKFIYAIKDCLNDPTDITSGVRDIGNDESSPPEFTVSSGRIDEQSSYDQPVATYSPGIPLLTYTDKQTDRSSPLVANYNNVVSGIPPSFSEMLASCFTDSRNVKQTVENANSMSFNEASKPKSAVQGGSVLPVSLPDSDIKSQIVKYMSDASFHDLLYKVEQFINESGGDLRL